MNVIKYFPCNFRVSYRSSFSISHQNGLIFQNEEIQIQIQIRESVFILAMKCPLNLTEFSMAKIALFSIFNDNLSISIN